MTTLVAAPARAQAPLVVGAVRDQRGVPVAGAVVVGRQGNQTPLRTTTDRLGTFALAAPGVTSVLVTCRYCGPAVVAVRAGEPVVVIVDRYEALTSDAPSPSDLENLPYAAVESAGASPIYAARAERRRVSRFPFERSRSLPNGSLLVDDGAPNYDVVNGSSPYELVPAQYERTATIGDASNAYLYGDQAAGGTVNAGPFDSDSNWQVATLGSDAIARAQIGRIILGPSSDRLPMTKSHANAPIFPRTSPWVQTSRSHLRPGANKGVRLRRARRSLPAVFPSPMRRMPIRNSRISTLRPFSIAAAMRSARVKHLGRRLVGFGPEYRRSFSRSGLGVCRSRRSRVDRLL